MPVSRRDALKLGSGGALALVIGGGAGWLDRRDGGDGLADDATAPLRSTSTTTSTTTSTAAPVDIPTLPNAVDPAIVALGHRVVATTGEDDLQLLLTALPGASDDPLVDAAAIVRAEFADRRTVSVDGWILAESEARAAAVVAYLCTDAGC